MNQVLRQHIERVVPLSDEEFDYILSLFTRKKYLKHQFLVQEGNYVEHDYFIMSGLAKASRFDEDGKEHIIQFGMSNCWISDPQAYHHQGKATLNVQCLEGCETLLITFKDREQLCADLQKMEYFFRKKATDESIKLQRRILCLISNNAKDKYEDLIISYPGLDQRVSKAMIASYLGVSRETLSG